MDFDLDAILAGISLPKWQKQRWDDAWKMHWHQFRNRWLRSFNNHVHACWKFFINRKHEKFNLK